MTTSPSPNGLTRLAVQAEHLRKVYGESVALDDVSLTVAPGEIFGILGPNGAGKTTAVECVIGLRHPDAGRVRVFGLDPESEAAQMQLHQIVGAQLQFSAQPDKIRVGEVLDLYRSFYRRPADLTDLVDALGLGGTLRSYYRSLSGGLRQRLSIALALIGSPRLAVLDEMTSGLDPQARRDTWGVIEAVRDQGVTILLVTHFMDEAERLCDRVAFIDRGRIVATDTPAGLAGRVKGPKLVRFTPSGAFDHRQLLNLPEVRSLEQGPTRVEVTGNGDLVNAVILTLSAVGVAAHDVELGASSLEDAFIELTGRRAQAAGASR
jgi:ABC-2 type transport system ATP-binding protein